MASYNHTIAGWMRRARDLGPAAEWCVQYKGPITVSEWNKQAGQSVSQSEDQPISNNPSFEKLSVEK